MARRLPKRSYRGARISLTHADGSFISSRSAHTANVGRLTRSEPLLPAAGFFLRLFGRTLPYLRYRKAWRVRVSVGLFKGRRSNSPRVGPPGATSTTKQYTLLEGPAASSFTNLSCKQKWCWTCGTARARTGHDPLRCRRQRFVVPKGSGVDTGHGCDNQLVIPLADPDGFRLIRPSSSEAEYGLDWLGLVSRFAL